MKVKEKFDFPDFRMITQTHECLKDTKILCIRPNRVLVRPYYPSGYKPSGLWIARNEKHPPVFGHIIGLTDGIEQYAHLEIGDHIMFRRFAIEVIEELGLKEPQFEGEKAPVAVLHVKSIQLVFRPQLVSMRV
jgi:co-chaperonin GroES (HSP10)